MDPASLFCVLPADPSHPVLAYGDHYQRNLTTLNHIDLLYIYDTTQCKMEVRILSGGVTKNLTLHGMSKIDFQPDFRNGLMLSFLLMYNTMGSKVNGLAVREHFL